MANTLRIKRRASGGSAGAPAALKNAELAYNETDNILYYGYGLVNVDDAASVISIAGSGAYATLTTAQTLSGNKTFSGVSQFSGNTSFTSNVSLGSLATATTPTAGANNTLVATTAFVTAAVAASTSGVSSVAGTANQVLVNGGTTGQTGAVTLSLPSNVTISNDLTVSNNVTVTGNLTVNGTTTTINSTTLSVDDKNIQLGNVATPTNTTADGGGITLQGTTDKTINWINATGAWTSSEDWDLASGKVYRIGGTSILSNTTLGSSVINSSLTSLGTITTGTWQATAIGVLYGGTGATTASGARTNLGLGTIATQNSNNVTITGGSISSLTTFDLVSIDGGTF